MNKTARSLLTALLLVAVACGGSGSGTEVGGDAPAGFDRVTNEKEGFTMVIPAGWLVLEGDDLSTEDVFDAAVAEMPELAAMEAELKAVVGQGVVFWAFDTIGSSPDFVNNINVIKAPRMGMDAETLRQINVQQMEAFFGGGTRSDIRTSLQGYEVVELEYTSAQLGVRGIGALILTDDTQWVVTLSLGIGADTDVDFDLLVDLFREI